MLQAVPSVAPVEVLVMSLGIVRMQGTPVTVDKDQLTTFIICDISVHFPRLTRPIAGLARYGTRKLGEQSLIVSSRLS